MWFSKRYVIVGLAPLGAALASRAGSSVARREHALPPGAIAGAEGALRCLEGLLADEAWRGARVRVSLSHQLVRFLSVPWSDELMGRASAQSYLRAQCAAVFGNRAHTWSIVADDVARGRPALACAVDQEFLSGLHQIVEGHGARIESLVPWMITAFNRCCRSIPEDCWFAAIEPGQMTLLDVREGSAYHVSVHGWEGDAATALERFVRRGALRNGTSAARPVCIADLAGNFPESEGDAARRVVWSGPGEGAWFAKLAGVSA